MIDTTWQRFPGSDLVILQSKDTANVRQYQSFKIEGLNPDYWHRRIYAYHRAGISGTNPAGARGEYIFTLNGLPMLRLPVNFKTPQSLNNDGIEWGYPATSSYIESQSTIQAYFIAQGALGLLPITPFSFMLSCDTFEWNLLEQFGTDATQRSSYIFAIFSCSVDKGKSACNRPGFLVS